VKFKAAARPELAPTQSPSTTEGPETGRTRATSSNGALDPTAMSDRRRLSDADLDADGLRLVFDAARVRRSFDAAATTR